MCRHQMTIAQKGGCENYGLKMIGWMIRQKIRQTEKVRVGTQGEESVHFEGGTLYKDQSGILMA